MKVALVLRPSITYGRHAVGNFRRTPVNGKELFAHEGRIWDLNDGDKDTQRQFNATVAKLCNDVFIINNGGLYPIVVIENEAPAAAFDLATATPPAHFGAALTLMPHILTAEEQASVLNHTTTRLEALQTKHYEGIRAAAIKTHAEAVALKFATTAPVVGDLPPEVAPAGTEVKDEASDNPPPPETVTTQDSAPAAAATIEPAVDTKPAGVVEAPAPAPAAATGPVVGALPPALPAEPAAAPKSKGGRPPGSKTKPKTE